MAAPIVNLMPTIATSGTLTCPTSGCVLLGSITPAQFVADVLAGNTYLNIHTSGIYAGGEIRGQIQ